MVSAFAWFVLAWAAVDRFRVMDRLRPTSKSSSAAVSPSRLAVGFGAVALLVVTVGAVGASWPRTWRDQDVFEEEAEIASVVLDAVGAGDDVLLVAVGRAAEFAVAPALAVDLVEADHRIGVPPSQETGYGEHLVAAGDFDSGVVLVSGTGRLAEWPGRLLARIDLNAASAEARAVLAEQIREGDPVVSERATDVLADLLGDASGAAAEMTATFFAGVADHPEDLLRHHLGGRALEAGYFSGLDLDPDALATLVDNPPVTVWNDDVIEVWLLGPDEIDANLDALMAVGIGRPVG